ncbi:HAD family hydrolase [Cognatishimia maritima]|uniref:Putative hydrolase of the HAD superfamily n=1 Tax=Cognatishimia maritima TaxID=870908 RepID=A0A1M5UDQ6_9RHOB|nr:HAD family hydrolase [Cognatishimia maritima]SHH61087.1 putative hydrolase of the HAD superfamily [Cognatishimia maritima]
MDFELVVWDFDGVLNANIIGGKFVWADNLEADLGLNPQSFSDFVFRSHQIAEVIRGKRDLLDVTQDWLDDQPTQLGASEFLEYWFDQDALPDLEVTGWLKGSNGRKVIGTNNETRRSSYIENQMGYGALVDCFFSSGRLGAAKPNVEFWQAIEAWSSLKGPQILLIDDSQRNIESAAKRGWSTFHFDQNSRSGLPAILGLA